MDRPTIPPKIIGAPGCYLQGRGLIDRLGEYAAALGQKPFLLADRQVWPLLRERVAHAMRGVCQEAVVELFRGECTLAEIDRTSRAAVSRGCDLVVGMGGGKTLDTAKGIALEIGRPILIVPTIASNDAPTSRLVVIYHQDGSWDQTRHLPRNPDMVLVDTQVIAQAPSRFLVAGMGDALCTGFEAAQCRAGGRNLNFLGGRQTRAAMVLARSAYELIRAYGLEAKLTVEQHLVTEAVEAVVEANVLLSGLGFESGGLSAAHSLTGGFSAVPELRRSLHGEQAAFGLLVQFVLENRDRVFMDDMLGFYLELGLPVSLTDMGLAAPDDAHFGLIAKESCYPGSKVFEMPQPVDGTILVDALKAAHTLGLDFKKRTGLTP